MPRGDKTRCTDKQKQKAEHIAEVSMTAAHPRPSKAPGVGKVNK
jgi:hypothetical protein